MRAALFFAWLICTSIVCWYMFGKSTSAASTSLTKLQPNSEIQVIDEASGSSYTDSDETEELDNTSESTSGNSNNNSTDENQSIEVTNEKDQNPETNSNDSKVIKKADVTESVDYIEKSNIQFNKNEVKLPAIPKLSEYLDSIAMVVKNENVFVVLVGHADQSKSRKHNNMQVGTKRANTIKAELVKRDVSADKIIVESKGDSEPRVTGNTPEARAKNRRVELFLKQNK